MSANLTAIAQTPSRRGAVFGIVLAAVIGGTIAVRSPARGIPAPFSPPTTVLPARIVPADFSNAAAEVGGTVTSIHVTPGGKVSAGDVIAVIESSEARSNLARAEARWQSLTRRADGTEITAVDPRSRGILEEQLAAARRAADAASERLKQFSLDGSAKAFREAKARRDEVERLFREGNLATKIEFLGAENQLEGAERDFNSARQLLSRLQQERDSAQSQVKILAMRLEAPEQAVDQLSPERREAAVAIAAARKQVEAQTLRARTAGTVLAVKVQPGDFAWIGSSVATVSDLSRLALEAALTAEMAAKIRPGNPVKVRLPHQSLPVQEAVVASVTLVPDQAQQSYQLRVILPNPAPDVILAGLEGAIEIEHKGQVR